MSREIKPVLLRYAERTTRCSNLLRRASHRRRYSIALTLVSPKPGQRILDYGACTGDFLKQLHAIQPAARYEGFEINTQYIAESQTILQGCPIRVKSSVDGSFDTIACLETLEHVPDSRVRAKPSLREVLAHIRSLMAHDGRLIISVPIEIGPPSLLKNIVRIFTDDPDPHITVRNVLLSAVYLPRLIARQDGHMGFDFRVLKRTILDSGFVITRQLFSPVPWAGPVFNSQVFWVARLPRESDDPYSRASPTSSGNVG